MLVGREPVFLVAGQERLHAIGVLPHPLELGGELLVELHVGLGLVPGDGIVLEALASTWRILGQSGRPSLHERRELLARLLGPTPGASLAMPPIAWSFWLEEPVGRVLAIVQVADRRSGIPRAGP